MDVKLRRLDVKHRWLWVCVLGAARQSPQPGWLFVAADVPWEAADLANYSGLSTRDVRAGMATMCTLGMVTEVEGVWQVPSWDERQFEGDFARNAIPGDVKAQVLARDNGQCQGCGTDQEITIDHIVPVTRSGTNELDNLQLLCKSCNSRKGNRLRQQRYRDNARNGDVTPTSRAVTAPETETETDVTSPPTPRPRSRRLPSSDDQEAVAERARAAEEATRALLEQQRCDAALAVPMPSSVGTAVAAALSTNGNGHGYGGEGG